MIKYNNDSACRQSVSIQSMYCVVCVCVLHLSSVPVEGGQHTSLPSQSTEGAAVTSCAAHIQRLGYPSMENLHFKADHVLSYNNRMRSANWVFEVWVWVGMGVFERERETERDSFTSSLQVLTKERCNNKMAKRSNCSFRPDEQVSVLFRPDDNDYKKSNFDRGHLAAAANHFHDQQAMDDTFLFTNISPQVLA